MFSAVMQTGATPVPDLRDQMLPTGCGQWGPVALEGPGRQEEGGGVLLPVPVGTAVATRQPSHGSCSRTSPRTPSQRYQLRGLGSGFTGTLLNVRYQQ